MALLLTTLFRRLRRGARRYSILLKTVLLPLLFLYFVDILLHTWSHAVPRPAKDLDGPFATRCQDPLAAASQPRANATFVMLAQNSEVEEACATIKDVERQFNQWFHYPILFLNDRSWDPMVVTRLRKCGSGEMTFDVIPSGEWSFPDGVDVNAAKQSIKLQGEKGIWKAGKESYHHMCRFFSG
jgi:mannosyltransferase